MLFCIFSGKPCTGEERRRRDIRPPSRGQTDFTPARGRHLRKQSQFKRKAGSRAQTQERRLPKPLWPRTGGGSVSCGSAGDFPAGETEAEEAQTEQAERAGLRNGLRRPAGRRWRREQRPRLYGIVQRSRARNYGCDAGHARRCRNLCRDWRSHRSHCARRKHGPDARSLEQQVRLRLAAQFQIGGSDDGRGCRSRNRCSCHDSAGRNARGNGGRPSDHHRCGRRHNSRREYRDRAGARVQSGRLFNAADFQCSQRHRIVLVVIEAVTRHVRIRCGIACCLQNRGQRKERQGSARGQKTFHRSPIHVRPRSPFPPNPRGSSAKSRLVSCKTKATGCKSNKFRRIGLIVYC